MQVQVLSRAEFMKPFFVYVLKSKRDGNLFVGLTENVTERLLRHNAGRVTSMKARAPLDLIYQEQLKDRGAARKREKYLKSQAGRRTLNIILTSVEPAKLHGGQVGRH